MLDLKKLESVRYVVDSRGRKAAVQIDLKTWNDLLGYLEEIEDRALLREKLGRLADGVEKSGAVPWNEVRKEW